jgi:hypothetical protein
LCSTGGTVGDSEGHLGQDGGLEDPLRFDQGDSGALEVEAAFEDRARDRCLAEAAALLGQEVEGAQADRRVAVVRHGGRAPSSPGVLHPSADIDASVLVPVL